MGTREPLGRSPGDTDPADMGADDDFAVEHEDTAVDKSIIDGRDSGESESPRGWAGLEEHDRSGN
ncbi:hypothetical protein SAMN05421684_1794 [Asanoa ishikariensis]|uniref:Uncharacterized protein n=1 Tax=Asanoa ishikariensis TaxID=137265 RepID=A0A1H3N5C3_9ACTN|nr:hypothetical protein [Asanoa ishikariensis]SDY83419.1 hypothetical protein SAMN05421684_1794 [Asanoa ishikariensis]